MKQGGRCEGERVRYVGAGVVRRGGECGVWGRVWCEGGGGASGSGCGAWGAGAVRGRVGVV